MMRKVLVGMACVAIACGSALAQQALWSGAPLVSPEVNADGSATFRLRAENAKKVIVEGDFLALGSEGMQPLKAEMQMKDGVWQYTTVPLQPEMYSYSFWVDGLRVADPSNVFQIRDVATISNIFFVGGGRDSLYAVQDVPHGTVSEVWYDSPMLGMQRRMTVYTPFGYEAGREEYPVLYLLHGMGGDETAWTGLGRAAQILDNLIAQGKAVPMVVVMPNGNVSQEAAPGETPGGMRQPQFILPKTMEGTMETVFPDILTFVEQTYRVKKAKSARAIAGLSMGGFHALHISKEYPDLFDYVGLFSAAILPSDHEGNTAESAIYENMDGKLMRQFAQPPALYWIGIGKEDFLYKANEDYRHRLDNLHLLYTYYENGEGHIWRNWRIYLSKFLPLLFKD